MGLDTRTPDPLRDRGCQRGVSGSPDRRRRDGCSAKDRERRARPVVVQRLGLPRTRWGQPQPFVTAGGRRPPPAPGAPPTCPRPAPRPRQLLACLMSDVPPAAALVAPVRDDHGATGAVPSLDPGDVPACRVSCPHRFDPGQLRLARRLARPTVRRRPRGPRGALHSPTRGDGSYRRARSSSSGCAGCTPAAARARAMRARARHSASVQCSSAWQISRPHAVGHGPCRGGSNRRPHWRHVGRVVTATGSQRPARPRPTPAQRQRR